MGKTLAVNPLNILSAEIICRIAVMTAQFQGERSVFTNIFNIINGQDRQVAAQAFFVAVAHEFNAPVG